MTRRSEEADGDPAPRGVRPSRARHERTTPRAAAVSLAVGGVAIVAIVVAALASPRDRTAPGTSTATLSATSAPTGAPSTPSPTPVGTPPTWSIATGAPIGPGPYQVREGDTLRSISDRSGASVRELLATNDLADPPVLRPGDVLVIP